MSAPGAAHARDFEDMVARLAQQIAKPHLELHPNKARIVYCKDSDRHGFHEHERFDLLGYTFRSRLVRSKAGALFVSFPPGGQRRRCQSDPSNDEALAGALAQRDDPHPISRDRST